ncbi:MAG: hypothetical protein U0521_17075 [Anaerolineae bacterium]
MDPALVTILTLISGISWTLVYISDRSRLPGQNLRDAAVCADVQSVVGISVCVRFPRRRCSITLQRAVNTIWCLFDLVIVYTYLRYGRSEFPKNVDQKWFLPWSIIVMVVSFATLYVAALEFGMAWRALFGVRTGSDDVGVVHRDAGQRKACAGSRFTPPYSNGLARLPRRSSFMRRPAAC